MDNYSKCLNCQAENIISDLELADAGAYPSHSHKVVSDTGFTSKLKAEVFGKKGGRATCEHMFVQTAVLLLFLPRMSPSYRAPKCEL